MSYNEPIRVILAALGITSSRLPDEGLLPCRVWYPRVHETVRVWVTPLAPRPDSGRRFKRSTHRLLCQCPSCGAELSAGRLHQHFGTAICVRRTARLIQSSNGAAI